MRTISSFLFTLFLGTPDTTQWCSRTDLTQSDGSVVTHIDATKLGCFRVDPGVDMWMNFVCAATGQDIVQSYHNAAGCAASTMTSTITLTTTPKASPGSSGVKKSGTSVCNVGSTTGDGGDEDGDSDGDSDGNESPSPSATPVTPSATPVTPSATPPVVAGRTPSTSELSIGTSASVHIMAIATCVSILVSFVISI